jgi:hypothetical protein
MNYLFNLFVNVVCIVICGASGTRTLDAEEHANPLGVAMVRIEPGTFLMGSNLPRDHWDEWPAHRVTIVSVERTAPRLSAVGRVVRVARGMTVRAG